MLWVNISLYGNVNECGGGWQTANVTKKSNKIVIEYVKPCCFNTLLIMSHAAYDKYQSQPPHTQIYTHHYGGSAKKGVTIFWDSFEIQLQRCQNHNRCFCPIPNTWAAPTRKTKALCVFFTDASKTHLFQLNGTHMSSGVVHRWLPPWLRVAERAPCEPKWAECGGPLMRLEWNPIPIPASLEACVT